MRRAGSIACVLVMALAGIAEAKTFKPTRFDDPNPGNCKAKDCSVREAVIAADAAPDKDRIKLEKGKYLIERPGEGGPDPDTSGDFNITESVAVEGAGAGKTKLDAQGNSRVFQLSGPDVSISGITVRGGVSDGPGGGIAIFGGAAELNDLTVKGNAASTGGGGIASLSLDLALERVRVSENHAQVQGGGIQLVSGSGNGTAFTTIKASTIARNTTDQAGAGIIADGANFKGNQAEPNLDISNSTIAKNEADGNAGGILGAQAASVILNDTTVGSNVADADDFQAGLGGGILQAAGAIFIVDDSVIAQNKVGSAGANAQCSGDFEGFGNVVSAPAGCTSFSGIMNLETGSRILQGLAKNGGPTETTALVPNSPAIGFSLGCPNRDQRGEKRPNDCDSGAFERNPKNR